MDGEIKSRLELGLGLGLAAAALVPTSLIISIPSATRCFKFHLENQYVVVASRPQRVELASKQAKK